MTAPRVIRAAFNQGGTPTIACINKATIPLGVNFDKLVSVLQKFVDTTFGPVWGAPAKLVPRRTRRSMAPGRSCFSMMAMSNPLSVITI
jgi:hypothetical protein